MKSGTVKDAVLIAVGLAGLYVAWKIFQGAGAVGKAITSTGEAIGSGLYDWLHPDQWDAYRFSTSTGHAVLTQIIDRNTGVIYNVANGKILSRAN